MIDKILITILGYTAGMDIDISNCDCNGFSDLEVVSGQIWPAWGQVSINDDAHGSHTNCILYFFKRQPKFSGFHKEKINSKCWI